VRLHFWNSWSSGKGLIALIAAGGCDFFELDQKAREGWWVYQGGDIADCPPRVRKTSMIHDIFDAQMKRMDNSRDLEKANEKIKILEALNAQSSELIIKGGFKAQPISVSDSGEVSFGAASIMPGPDIKK